jgi:hypothetical protein
MTGSAAHALCGALWGALALVAAERGAGSLGAVFLVLAVGSAVVGAARS